MATLIPIPPTPHEKRPYATAPDPKEWKRDSRAGRQFGPPRRKADSVLAKIDGLVELLRTETGGSYMYVLGDLFFTTMYWLNHYMHYPKMDARRRPAILRLNLYAGNELAAINHVPVGAVADVLRTIYGVEMHPYGIGVDTREDPRYMSGLRREQYRAFFKDGKVYRFRASTDPTVEPIDTRGCQDAQRGGFGFVLSMSNELYIAPFGHTVPYHSSFTGGSPVQCAGMVQISAGKVTDIQNDSGHYRPSDPSLVKVLRLFQMVGINIKDITVHEEIGGGAADGLTFLRNNGNWNGILARAGHQPPVPPRRARRVRGL